MAARRSKASTAATAPPEASSRSSSWSDLPPELAGLVLRRFPSLADRVRFGSICRHWRHAARLQATVLPPVLPWTITSHTGKVQTIPDGEVHRLCSGKLATCSFSSENWLLMIGRASRDDVESRNFLENPLSGATLPLPGPDNLLHPGDGLYRLTKLIVCPDNLVVATIIGHIPGQNDPLIVCCRPDTSSWSTRPQVAAVATDQPCYQDIAFHNGNIYAITERGDLFAYNVSEDDHGQTVLSSVRLVIKGGDAWSFNVTRFLVVSSCGRLLMVKWNHGWGCNFDDDVVAFEVFEADQHMASWSRLLGIDDQVLFVSQKCSKAVPVSASPDDYLRGNRIYFVDHAIRGPRKCRYGSTSCGMYDLGNNTYHAIMSDAFRANDIAATSWFFPHE